ncbi:MAG: hypothetical protein CMM77_09775 [Rhodospirillaceae bacterium]|nr:hypothetical protein [Magnetovibrio sp.]MAY67403.1 hypothetical protein [Rhodospirillaceae bacterium]
MSEQNGKNSTAKPAGKPAATANEKPAAKASDTSAKTGAGEAPAKKSFLNSIPGVAGLDGSAATWKRVALVLFVVAGLAVVAAVDYASDVSQAQTDMSRLRAQVAEERTAMKAAQDKFMKESADIAEAVANKKAELAATEADIEKRRAEAQELEAKLSSLYTETKTALEAASEAARKQADAQAALEKLNAERAKLIANIKSGRENLSALEKDADSMMQGLKETITRIKGALDKL